MASKEDDTFNDGSHNVILKRGSDGEVEKVITCSLFTMASILAEKTKSQNGGGIVKRAKNIWNEYKNLVEMNPDGIIDHSDNKYGIFYTDHVSDIAGCPSEGKFRRNEVDVYGFFRDIAFGQKGNQGKPRPNIKGMVTAYMLANGPLKGLRLASEDSRVKYLTENEDALKVLRDNALGAKEDSRVNAFLDATEENNLQENAQKIGIIILNRSKKRSTISQ